MRTLPALAAAVGLGLSAVVACANPADAALPKLSCSASMSNSRPKDYTTTDVNVKTSGHAHVKTVAAYKTTKTTHRGTASAKGRASISYYISRATPGYKVKVSVTVTKNNATGHCSTSFTPKR